jgi:nucleotide-binding universal stress UspA family protein
MPTIPQVARLSLKNILFPTDFSTASTAALPFALALARIYGSTLLIAHAIPLAPHRQVVVDPLPAQDDRVWQDARHQLDEFIYGGSLGDTSFKVLLDQGDLGDVIPAFIREHEADLVVLGTHGRRGISKLVLGSDAEKIYCSASCPVLTIGPHVYQTEDGKLRSILCPVDVAEDSGPVLRYALSLAEENQAEIIVLQAIPLVPWQHRESVEQSSSRRTLESLMPAQAQDWCTPQYMIRWEYPVEAILLTSQERDTDLIVMSVHKARVFGLAAHLPWPVASEVVSRALCPVLTIRV